MTKIICPYCNAPAKLRDTKVIYGRSYGKAWICVNYPECDAYVGCHGDGGKPKGTLANAELRELRKQTHAAFDPIWRVKKHKRRAVKRSKAYRWLADVMGLSREGCHIGKFDTEQCREAIGHIKSKIEQLATSGRQDLTD